MRAIAIIAGIIAVAAGIIFYMVSRRADDPPAPACARSAVHPTAFSDPQRQDSVKAASAGPSCGTATLTLALSDAAGKELWRYEASYVDLAYGGARPEGTPQVTDAEMDAYLAQWAEVTSARASSLPAWPEGAARLALVDNGGLATDTPLQRADYEALRKADVRTLCYAATIDVSHCIAFSADAGKARLIAAFGPHGADLRINR